MPKRISMRIFKRLFDSWFVCISASIGYILCLLSDSIWLADMVVHWRVQMAGVSLLFAIIFIFQKRKKFSLWLLVLAVGFAFPAYQSFAPAPPPEGKEKARLTILQFNVLYINDQFTDSIPWIIKQNADVVVLQEINKSRANELGELKKHYAWSRVKLNENREAFGMAIFSNLPVTKFDYVNIGDGWNRYSLTELLVNGTKLHLYELHTPPPVIPFFFEQRNLALSKLADVMSKDTTQHRLLLGDLNTTIHSTYFKNLLNTADLHHAQQGFNIEGSWHSELPVFMRIGIDHILASKQIKIEKREIAPAQNSDHLPVITTLSLYDKN